MSITMSSSGATRPRGDHQLLLSPLALRGLWRSDWATIVGGRRSLRGQVKFKSSTVTVSSQVKSSPVVGLATLVVVGLRDRVAIIGALLHAVSSPQPYAGYTRTAI